MPRWYFVLLPFGLAAFVADLLAAPPVLVFTLAAIGIIPLASLIGRSTEELAVHIGPKFGGLLNATFGNAAEPIIVILALQAGLLNLVKASITGSIIGNSLLVLGAAFLLGGTRYGIQRFDPREAGRHSVMMLLAVAALFLPPAFQASLPDPFLVEEVSIILAVVLLLVYAAYITYSLSDKPEVPLSVTPVEINTGASGVQPEAEHNHWKPRTALLALLGSTVATVLVSEVLVHAVEPMTQTLGWTEFFVGIIIIPIIGNVAEHVSAVGFARRNQMDTALAIAAGSSTQVALLVAPLAILISLIVGNPMNLVFHPLELTVLGLSSVVFAFVGVDGESHALEGVQLIALYVMAAVLFFFLPG